MRIDYRKAVRGSNRVYLGKMASFAKEVNTEKDRLVPETQPLKTIAIGGSQSVYDSVS